MKISKNIRLTFSISMFAGVLFAFAGCNTTGEKSVQPEIDSIAAIWVPDQRIGICKVTARPDLGGAVILCGETTDSAAKNEIIKTLNKQGIKLVDSIIILPDTLRNQKYLGLVTLSVINLRKHPDHRSELVSQAILGTPVLILKEEDSWLLIRTPDKYISWTEKSSVRVMNISEMNNWKRAKRIIYIRTSGWIYYSSRDDSDVVGDLVAGCIMESNGESKGYIDIVLPDGRKGFVNKKDAIDFNIFRNQGRSDGEKVIRFASSLLGVPYLWGGSSTKGVDCSGFVQTVFYMNGLILMRDASLQALHGEPVDISNGFSRLRKGDLLFFGSKEDTKSHVTHVAIYKGDNEYINSSGRVMVNSLDSTATGYDRHKFYSLLEARRFIGVENDFGIVPINEHKWY
ncbi:MAG: glycoside hydrolase [Bacteroidetes bacterium]|nr:MAG: glycoside hydrolase [Bacteroidota bacterium]